MLAVPPSAVLVAWGNAWLTGHVGLDEAADAIENTSGPHVLAGLPDEDGEVTLRRGLGTLRVAGLTSLRLALPAAGDPLGLSGPPALNQTALQAGEATMADIPGGSLGLVPAADRRGSSYVGVRTTAHPANSAWPDVPTLKEADHVLTTTIRDATDTLLQLDVARWRPEVAETLDAVRAAQRHAPAGGLPPGYPQRAHRVATMASRLAVILQEALEDEGGARTLDEMSRRSTTLRELDRAVRRAQVAAHNAVVTG